MTLKDIKIIMKDMKRPLSPKDGSEEFENPNADSRFWVQDPHTASLHFLVQASVHVELLSTFHSSGICKNCFWVQFYAIRFI